MNAPHPAGSPQVRADVARYVAALAEDLTGHGGPTTPQTVVDVARVAVPHARHAALTLVRADRQPRTIASSDPLPVRVDELQYRLDDGPCLDAATGPPVSRSDDVGLDDRWPQFGPACVEVTGIRSMLSLRLPVGGTDHAALNLYAEEPGAFSAGDVVTGSVLAPFAALVVEADLRREDVTNLTAALETSRSIGTAVGILMASHHVSRDDAFDLLRRASMDLNAKLRDVAAQVELTGALPEHHAAPRRPAPRRRGPHPSGQHDR